MGGEGDEICYLKTGSPIFLPYGRVSFYLLWGGGDGVIFLTLKQGQAICTLGQSQPNQANHAYY